MRLVLLGNHEVSYSSETHHANSLEQLGHTVTRLQEPKTPAETVLAESKNADALIWIHTHGWETPDLEPALHELKATGVPVIAYHLDLYMGIGRWRRYENSPYMRVLDYFFTVDRLMADWLNQNTTVTGHYLPAAVYGPECYLAEPGPVGNDVVFVGSKNYHREWNWRPALIDWLRHTYSDRFTHVGGDGDTGTVRGHALNQVYAASKIAVGDTLCMNFDYPDYWSDRVYETLGRGGFIIHPRIKGMEDHFIEGEHLVFYDYGDFDGLKGLIDHYLEHEDERETIRRAGHEHVKANHTYTQRWQTILDTVFA